MRVNNSFDFAKKMIFDDVYEVIFSVLCYQLSTMPRICANCGKTIRSGNVLNGNPYCDFGCANEHLSNGTLGQIVHVQMPSDNLHLPVRERAELAVQKKKELLPLKTSTSSTSTTTDAGEVASDGMGDDGQ